jgi:hypothetical protein
MTPTAVLLLSITTIVLVSAACGIVRDVRDYRNRSIP